MEFSDEELLAAQQAVAKNNEPPKVDTPAPVADPPPPAPIADPPAPSSLTAEETEAAQAKALADAEALKNNPPAPQNFDEQLEKYLEENTGGKFKKFEEIKAVLDTPKEDVDAEIEHFKALKKSGIKLDEDFFKLQALDVGAMTDPEEIVLEAMRRKPENQNLSDRTLRYKINEKYKVEEWINKDDADLTEADIANREIMMSDAQNDLEFLEKYKADRTFVNPVNQEQLKIDADQRKQILESHAKFVDDELIAKGASLVTQIQIDKDTKETFEYKPSEAVRKKAGEMMKLMTSDLAVVVNQFAEKDAGGNVKINDRKLFEMLVKNDTYDEAVQNAFKDGMAHGAKGFVKNDLKNASFKPGDNPNGSPIATTEAEAIALAIKASQNKLT
jgi:hypothetical protein